MYQDQDNVKVRKRLCLHNVINIHVSIVGKPVCLHNVIDVHVSRPLKHKD